MRLVYFDGFFFAPDGVYGAGNVACGKEDGHPAKKLSFF